MSPEGSQSFPGGLAAVQDGSRLWHQSCGAGSAGMQDSGVRGSWRHPPRFQGKSWEARQGIAGPESLQAPPENSV